MVLWWGRASLDPEHCCSPVRRGGHICQQGPGGYQGVILATGESLLLPSVRGVVVVPLSVEGFLCEADLGDLRSAATASLEALSLRPDQLPMVQSSLGLCVTSVPSLGESPFSATPHDDAVSWSVR